MRPVVVTVGPLAAASANAIALSQTPTSGTALTLNGALVTGGVAVMDKPRRVLLTYGNEGSARTLVVTGTGRTGQVQSETLAVPSGAGGTVATVLDYATVTSLLPAGGGWTAAVTVGTNGVASTPWVYFDEWPIPATSIQCTVSGTVNYTVQATLDDPNSPTNPVALTAVTWVSSSDTAVVGATATAQSNFGFVPKYARVLLNSGTGSVTATFIQSGNVNA